MKKIFQIKKTHVYLALILVFLLSMNSCIIGINGTERIRGSKNVVIEKRELPYFNSIEVSKSIDVFITIGDVFNVEVKADDNILPYITTEVVDDVLKVGEKPKFSLVSTKSQEVHITMPLLLSIKASGASNVQVLNKIENESLFISASGASDIKLNASLSYLEVRLSGASDVDVEGYAEFVKAEMSGASDMKDYDFSCKYLDVNLSGSSDIKVSVIEKISGNISGSSDIKVNGDPLVDVITSGASSVSRLER